MFVMSEKAAPQLIDHYKGIILTLLVVLLVVIGVLTFASTGRISERDQARKQVEEQTKEIEKLRAQCWFVMGLVDQQDGVLKEMERVAPEAYSKVLSSEYRYELDMRRRRAAERVEKVLGKDFLEKMREGYKVQREATPTIEFPGAEP